LLICAQEAAGTECRFSGSPVNLLLSESFSLFSYDREPEIDIQFLQLLAAQISKAMSEDFLAGTIQQKK